MLRHDSKSPRFEPDPLGRLIDLNDAKSVEQIQVRQKKCMARKDGVLFGRAAIKHDRVLFCQ